MKLLGTLSSPYVRKVRIVLIEKKIEYEFVQEDLANPSELLCALNPLAKVPCLVLEDQKTIYDSPVIVDYLDTVTPVGKLLPATGRPRAEMKCCEALADGILDAAVLVWLEKTRRAQKHQSPAWITLQISKVQAGLKSLSEQLGDKTFFFENRYSLADIAVGCMLGWIDLKYPEIGWSQQYPNLAALFARLSERLSFQQTLPQ